MSVDVGQYIIVQQNSGRHPVLFMALYTMGFSIGDLLWPISYRYLVEAFAWRGAFLIHGAFMFNHAVLICIQTSWVKFARNRRTKRNNAHGDYRDYPGLGGWSYGRDSDLAHELRKIDSITFVEIGEHVITKRYRSAPKRKWWETIPENDFVIQQLRSIDKIGMAYSTPVDRYKYSDSYTPTNYSDIYKPYESKWPKWSKLSPSRERPRSETEGIELVETDNSPLEGTSQYVQAEEVMEPRLSGADDAGCCAGFLDTNLSAWDILIIVAYFLHTCAEAFCRFLIGVRTVELGFSRTQIMWVMSSWGIAGLLRFLPALAIDRWRLNR